MVMAIGLFAGPALAGSTKVLICHFPEDGSEPHYIIVDSEEADAFLSQGDFLIDSPSECYANSMSDMLTICHKGKVTLVIPKYAWPAHFVGHGDTVGSCYMSNMVAICHKPGHKGEKTLYIPESALKGHLGHGDTEGECP